MKTFFLFLFSSNLLFSQNIDWLHYQPIKCEGIIPDDFIKLSSQKFEEGKKQIDVNTKTEARKTQEQFYLNANYKMDEVLRGGRVVFGDPVTSYLNQIKNLLLKDNLKLANEIRIYTLRSTDVNAFTTNDGIVLVTTGLVAQVDNEAQLAFILSHEFNHYIKKHAINEYVENRAMEKGTGIYKNISSNEIEAKAFSYSKELESEADELGLQLYKKSDYSFDAAEKVFDVLLYSYLPFDEVEFKKDYFNKESYHIPDDYFLETVNAISAIDDYDDEKNTHPNIKKRRNNILDSLKNVSDDGRKPFLISETEFNNVRKMCRYEMCLINLNNCEFEEAFYNSFLLLKDDPKNIFLNKIKSRALYGASMYKNSLHTTEYKKYYGDIEGNEEQVYFLFDKIPNLELNILALRTAFYTFLSDTTDGTVLRICNDLAKQLVRENDISFNEFADSFIVFKKDTLLNVENDTEPRQRK